MIAASAAEPTGTRPTRDEVHRAPKVLLHDHLDGGLRPQTIIDLAAEVRHELPAGDAESLGRWFAEAADSGSLERYLETFDHTVAVMQTADALTRVARECVEDLAADGVVYAEVRYAPEQHVTAGLTLDEVVAAVQAGFEAGAAAADGRIVVRQLLTAMRHAARSMEIAELSVAWRDRGVAGFDIAGAEAGYPPDPAPRRVRVPPARELTLHDPRRGGLRAPVDLAGHPVVWRRPARSRGADHRRRHRAGPEDRSAAVELGLLAAYVRDKRIPLEMCPTSNVQTGAADLHRRAPDRRAHPAPVPGDRQHRQSADEPDVDDRRDVGVSSRPSATTLDDLRWFTINAMKSAFLPFDERLAIIDDIVKPGYARLAAGS